MAAEPNSVMFETAVAVTGYTGIVVPEEAIETLAAGQRPPVLVNVKGVRIPEHGRHDGRQAHDQRQRRRPRGHRAEGRRSRPRHPDRRGHPAAGDPPRRLRRALAADEQASAFFGRLSNSMPRYHADSLAAARSADTRQRGIDKAIVLFGAGRHR